MRLRWLAELKLIQLEQQKTQLHKRYIKLSGLEINKLRVQIFVAKMT